MATLLAFRKIAFVSREIALQRFLKKGVPPVESIPGLDSVYTCRIGESACFRHDVDQRPGQRTNSKTSNGLPGFATCAHSRQFLSREALKMEI